VEVLSTRDVQGDQGSIWHKNHLLDAFHVTYPEKGGGVWAKGGKGGKQLMGKHQVNQVILKPEEAKIESICE